MEYQNTISPEPYSPMKILKRETRWEQIFDVDGSLWNVREARATKHGFDLLFGIPANSGISPRDIGPKRLIATPALVAYWEVNRTNEGAVNDLPAGRSTLKRIRKRLRFDFFQDRRNLWKKRTGDMKTLPTGEFADRYNVPTEQANDWRMRLVGRVARPLDWWQHPEALAILRNPGITRTAMAKALNIGTSHAHRLRLRALNIDPKVLEQEVAAPIPQLAFERKPTLPPLKPPFFHQRPQGEFFVGSAFWRRPKSTQPIKASPPPSRRTKKKHLHSQATAKRLGQLLLPFQPSHRDKAKPILLQVQDFAGNFCDVYESRPTKHGFDLLFGYKTKAHRRIYTDKGKPGLLPTPELVAYWEAHRADLQANLDLPAGQTTLIRLRMRLGFNQTAAYNEMWRQRLPDLQSLSVREFAQKYNVSEGCASGWRRKLLHGKKASQPAPLRQLPEKWRTPEALAALRSDHNNRTVGRTLAISGSHVARLRLALSVTPPELIS